MKIPEICKNLRKVRLNLGYTQKEVAAALDYGQDFISMMETGKSIPNKRHIILFSNFYKVPITEIDPSFEFTFAERKFKKLRVKKG